MSRVDSLSLLLSNPLPKEDPFDYHYHIRRKREDVEDAKKKKAESYDYFHYDGKFDTAFYNTVEQTFGQCSGRTIELFEDETILQNQNHFKQEDFLILFRAEKFQSMIDYITDRFPAITKLALIVDHRQYFDNIHQILSLFPAKLKVLLLERTFRDGCRVSLRNYDRVPVAIGIEQNILQLPDTLYRSLIDQSSLEKLYFFPKRLTQIILNNKGENRYEFPIEIIDDFLETMLCRLQTFHINSFAMDDKFCYPFPCRRTEEYSIEELKCPFSMTFTQQELSFPRLKKFFYKHCENPRNFRNEQLMTNCIDPARMMPFRNITELDFGGHSGVSFLFFLYFIFLFYLFYFIF